ncbi:MAG: Dabb family protein [Gemmataceae bacterium]
MMRLLGASLLLLAIGPMLAAEEKKGMLVHAVIFTLKKDSPATAVDDVIADCHKMLGKIKSVRKVMAGRPTKEKAEPITQTGYDVGMIILVDDFAGLKAYLEDPIHVEFVKKWGKSFDIEKLKVYDFVDTGMPK